MESLKEWISQPPKFTTFRINILKTFSCDVLRDYLIAQADELNAIKIPNFFLLKPDCLILEQWSEDVTTSKTCKEVIVDSQCAAAVLRGAHVFAPGVMGLPVNCSVGEEVDIYGDLEGNCKRGLKVSYNGKKLLVGTGSLRMLRSELFVNGIQPNGIAVHTILPVSRIPVVNESIYPKGVVLLQNLPSIVCGWVVDAKPYETILDMCAAPGNKTTHLAEMSRNQAKIIAIDKTAHKAEKIRESCKIHGVTCITAYAFDSTKCCSTEGSTIDMGPPFLPNSFDKVLLDAPCSGLGQRPQLRNTNISKMLESYKFVQRKLMSKAVDVLKVGGRLVYSTCTVTIEENEGMVQWALEKFPSLQLVPSHPILGGPALDGCGLSKEQRLMVQRFGPELDPLRPVETLYRDTIGFFIAAFTKVK